MKSLPRNKKGMFLKGHHYHKSTEFKKGEHWRSHKPFWEYKWLDEEYVEKGRSSMDIAKQFGVKDASILYWLNKHKIKRRTISEVRRVKKWGSPGPLNPMYGKRGKLHPNWRGGSTPERQAFYSSYIWRKTSKDIWKRDNYTCQLCRKKKSDVKIKFHIHHIVSFIVKKLRYEMTNLVLLCEICHRFVHSRKNLKSVFLQKEVIEE